MSNNLISSMQMESSLPEMPMGVVGPVGYVSGLPKPQQFPLSNKPTTIGLDNPLPHGLPSGEMQVDQSEGEGIKSLQSQQFLAPNNQTGQMGSTMNRMEQMSAPVKRKAPMEPVSQNRMSETVSMQQKRLAQMLHRPWMLQQNKKAAQLESAQKSPGSLNSPTSNKNLVKTDSFSNRAVSQRTPSLKTQSARTQHSSKGSTESVRSKMREQLASALSLVTEEGAKPSPIESNSPGEADNLRGTDGNPHPADVIGNLTKESNNSEQSSAKNNVDGDVLGESQKIFPDVSGGFQPSYELSYEDVPFSENFFVKDELLQGNGLAWVMDPDLEMAGKPNSDSVEANEDRVGQSCYQSPQDVALEIEAELFKLFGGVNKKYKEKGRSLLFNLKDRSNPELRERVMAGEISPKRLCSMSAEDLASKELSQWRMAKAEEFAQMVVLPDTEVDIRRLVRKTHKGEFQVEVEQDDSLPVDVSGGSSSLSQSRPINEIETRTKPRWKRDQLNASSKKSNLEHTQTLTIHPTEGTDLLQGLMVDDELKDVDFLPPIVSLDEFMESLNSEPPFENLPLDSEMTPLSDKDDNEAGSGSKSIDLSSKDVVDSTRTKTDGDESSNTNVDSKSNDSHTDTKSKDRPEDVKSSGSPLIPETALYLSGTTKGDHVWGGSLQLNVSSTAKVIGVFKSGEKTSTNEWPRLIDIKGRVRLDAFEKFLNQLPLSRSRAVMVVHFVLKEGSSENELAALREVSDSYVVDERVGFAEPAPGVELYFCPPHNKTLEMLGKVIQKEQLEALNKINNGLIGVIVWRKLSSTSPKSSSSHHKHSSKKQHLTSRKQQDSKLNSNLAPKSVLRQQPKPPPTVVDDDDGDDVPPGFGPLTTRDDDDLPEFNFSGGSIPPVSHFSAHRNSRGSGMAALHAPLPTSRPVEQVRELIHKYGQQSNARASWNNDDDDDIPEWQPQAPLQPMTRPHYVNQQPHGALVPQPGHQTSENAALWQQQQQQQGTWWAGSAQASNTSSQPDPGQYYGALGRGTAGQSGTEAWQQNVHKSREF